jgi:hypothetical protein
VRAFLAQSGHVTLDGAPADPQGLGQVGMGGSRALGLGLGQEPQDAVAATIGLAGDILVTWGIHCPGDSGVLIVVQGAAQGSSDMGQADLHSAFWLEGF